MAADVTAAGFKGILTNALYDTWWHGGFRTAPYYHNSIGILTEAASARLMSPSNVTREQLDRSNTRGMRSATEVTTNFPNPWEGGAWHPRDIMQMELIACHSVLSLAANYRADYLSNFYELGKANLAPARPGEPLGYVITAGQGRDENLAKMIGALVEQGVEVFRLDKELHGETASQLLLTAGNIGSKGNLIRRVTNVTGFAPPEIPAGSYIVFLNQPYRQNVLALFEPQVYPDRITPTGEAERPYDVAGWTLPMQMGLQTLLVTSLREPPGQRKLTLVRNENEVRSDLGLALWTSDRSPIVNPVKPGIRVAIYQNSRAGNMDEGWTRFVFDAFNVPFETLREGPLNEDNPRARFDAIVLPSDRTREPAEPGAEESDRRISDVGLRNLARFVEDGGTLICFDGSCGPLIKQWKLPLRNVLEGLRSADFYCPGSVLRVDLDTANPIARSMMKETDVYFTNSSAFELTNTPRPVFDGPQTPWPVRVIARYAKDGVLQSGWLLGEEKIKDRIALAETQMGKGRIILFGFRPQHRGQTWGTLPLIWNAINLSGR
jgi:hypothetical protein